MHSTQRRKSDDRESEDKCIFILHRSLSLSCIFCFILSSAQAPIFEWAKKIGSGSDDISNSIALDSFGNVYTTGSFIGTVDFDPGVGTFNLISLSYQNIFISKLDASGNFVWAKNIGGALDDCGYSIFIDSSGNIYTTGVFWGTADFDPGLGTYNLTVNPATGYSDMLFQN